MDLVTLKTNAVQGIDIPAETSKSNREENGAFSEFLKSSINEVNQMQTEADQSINDLATGKETDLHKTMIAMEKADVAFQLMMQVRNKVISAYEEISRMSI